MRPPVARGSRYLRPFPIAGLVALAPAPSAHAATPDPRVVRVDYEVPRGCPDRSAFEQQVERRTAPFASDADRPPSFLLRVVVATSARGFSGTLGVTGPTGERSTRSLAAASCAEVTDALALMAALAIDPLGLSQASPLASGRPPLAAPPPAPAPPPIAPPPAAAMPLAIPQAPRGAAPDLALHTPVVAPDAGPRQSRSRPSWQLGAGAGAAVVWGVAPGVMVAPVGFLEASSPYHGPWGLSLRAGFERASRSDVGDALGQANFTWTVGTLEACPARWMLRAVLSVSACARVEAGELDGTGVTGTLNREAKEGWLAADLLGRLRWAPIPHVSVDIDAGARVPFFRETFEFEPSLEVYQPAPVSALLGANVGAFF